MARSSNRLIDPFDVGMDFEPRRARYDKIEVGISFGRCVTNDTTRVHELFHRIRQTKWLLCDGSAVRPKLEVRKRKNSLLFNGTINFHPNSAGGYLRAYITFNPSRYFAHNPASRPRERERNGTGFGMHYKLTQYPPALAELTAKTFDGSDNFILDKRLREANSLNWSDYTTDLLQDIIALISDTIRKYDRDNLFTFVPRQLSDWSLRGAELYWEFRQPDAVTMAKIFGAHMANNYVRHRVSYYGDKLAPMEDISGAICSWVFYTGTENVHLALYAKANNRIRVECRFTSTVTKIYSSEFPDKYPFSRSDIRGLLQLLRELKSKSYDNIYKIGEERRNFDPTPLMKAYDAVDTVTALNFAAGTDQLSMLQVIKTIKMASRVSETGKSAYDKCLHRMVQRGLLKQIGRKKPDQPRHYQPSRAFSSFIALLTIPNPAAGLWNPRRHDE